MRFPFRAGGKWGYLDSTARVVVGAKYHRAGQYSEGLAAVQNGKAYGFMDAEGRWVVRPRFDHAYAFDRGLAEVHVGMERFFIDRHGHQYLRNIRGDILRRPAQDLFIVQTGWDSLLLVDRHGNLLCDRNFHEIGAFSEGVAVASAFPDTLKDKWGNYWHSIQVCMVDTLGRIIVPLGRYSSISQLHEGFAVVSAVAEGENGLGVIDSKGEMRFSLEGYDWQQGGMKGHEDEDISTSQWFFSEGLAVLDLIVNESRPKLDPGEGPCLALMDSTGQVVGQNCEWDYVTPFCGGRALGRKKEKFQLIDRNLVALSDVELTSPANPFEDFNHLLGSHLGPIQWWLGCQGKTLVALDSMGNVVQRLRKRRAEVVEHVVGEVAYLKAHTGGGRHKEVVEYRWWNLRTGQVSDTVYSRLGFTIGIRPLTQAWIGDRMRYLDREGREVWREANPDSLQPQPLDIDFIRKDPRRMDGRWPGNLRKADSLLANNAQKIPQNFQSHPHQLQLAFDFKEDCKHSSGAAAWALYLANTTADTAVVPSFDHVALLVMQAKDHHGVWRDIELMPRPACGWSYTREPLPSGECWRWVVPQYTGGCKTLLRAKLLLDHPKSSNSTPRAIYSKPFKGSFNPAQFWRRLELDDSGYLGH